MKRGGSSKKGGKFERETCKTLSVWVTANPDTPEIFWRSISSGGHHTRSRKKGKSEEHQNQSGDISSLDPLGDQYISKITTELKHVNCLEIEQLIYDTAPSRDHLLTFWRTHLELAESVKKLPILIGRQDRKEDLICFNISLFQKLNYLSPLGIFPDHDLAVYSFEYFLANCPYSKFAEDVLNDERPN